MTWVIFPFNFFILTPSLCTTLLFCYLAAVHTQISPPLWDNKGSFERIGSFIVSLLSNHGGKKLPRKNKSFVWMYMKALRLSLFVLPPNTGAVQSFPVWTLSGVIEESHFSAARADHSTWNKHQPREVKDPRASEESGDESLQRKIIKSHLAFSSLSSHWGNYCTQ